MSKMSRQKKMWRRAALRRSVSHRRPHEEGCLSKNIGGCESRENRGLSFPRREDGLCKGPEVEVGGMARK